MPSNARLLAAVLHVWTSLSSVDAFSAAGPIACSRGSGLVPLHFSKIIDAEVIPDDELGDQDEVLDPVPVSLVEYSQNQDPEWKSMPVAFCDTLSNTYVDCNLAFYVKDPLGDGNEGAEYALGVPCEVPIVVALELGDDQGGSSSAVAADGVVNLSKVIPINPDDESDGGSVAVMSEEEKEGIFQMAARALMDEFGQKIRLKKTPRVLTIEGNLEGAMGDWKEILLGGVDGGKKEGGMSFEEALEAYDEIESMDNDEEDFFDKIMKRDLGPDYMKLVEDDDDDSMDEELLKLFDLESLDEDLDDLMDDIDAKGNKVAENAYEELVQRLQPSAALKLVNFLGPGGKEYTILRPLRPVLLLGKEDPDDYTRRILLTREELSEVLPRLESTCREGLEKAGFFLAGSSEEN